MEHLTCPVCETQNDHTAAHCEVCGERLSALEPGEVLAPEENVSAMLEPIIEEPNVEQPSEESAFENAVFPEDDFPAAAIEAVSSAIQDDVVEPSSDVLYSPLDGTAYAAGTPEFEDGFGPMGEALVATRPDNVEGGHANIGQEEDTANAGFDENTAAQDSEAEESEVEDSVAESTDDSYIDSAGISGSPQFREMFKSEPKVREPLAPLPRPGIHTNPATLSVFVNREEAHRHYIENDETLLGRRDPHSDAYPDLDLGAFDEKALISRKHAYVYRQNKNYTLYVVSNSGTQLNNDLLSLGDRRPLKNGDVIVLAGILAIKFELADS